MDEFIFEEAIENFGSLIKTIEFLGVLEQKKPVMRTLLSVGEIRKISELCKKYNLHYDISDFKIHSVYENGFSNKGYRVNRNSTVEGDYVFYIGKNHDWVREAKSAEYVNDHKMLARFLGYPKCCTEYFIKHNPIQEERGNDYVLPAFQSSKGNRFSFLLNVVGRSMDVGLISHFPCSFHCDTSKKLAIQNLAMVSRYNKKYAEFLEKKLKGSFVYSEDHGIHVLDSNSDGKYSKVFSPYENKLAYDLRCGNKIVGNKIFSGDNLIKKYDMHLMHFI